MQGTRQARTRRRMAIGAVVLTAAMVLGGCRFEFTVEALTADADGSGTNDGSSSGAQVSGDGTKVIFTSRASDLGPADTNGAMDVYLHDLESRTTSLVSVNTAGGATALGAWDPELSADGTKVAFISTGDSFGPPDPYDNFDQDADVLLHDLTTGSTLLVSGNAAGDNGGNRRSEPPVFTPDGSALYFVSWADDLLPGDTNGRPDIYRYDIASGGLSLTTTNVAGAAANGSVIGSPLVSPDGRRLVFTTEASDLGPRDTNGGRDIYARDLVTGATSLVTVNAAGTDAAAGRNDPYGVRFDSTGARLVYTTAASDMGPVDTNGQRDVYVHDFTTGEKVLVSADASGDDSGEYLSVGAAFGRDGELVAFASLAGDLGPEDDNEGWDIYVHDLTTGLTSIVSPQPNQAVAPHGSQYTGCLCEISGFTPDGRTLLLATYYGEVFVEGDGRDDDYDLFLARF
jgi:Tol biopolymer transport system component